MKKIHFKIYKKFVAKSILLVCLSLSNLLLSQEFDSLSGNAINASASPLYVINSQINNTNVITSNPQTQLTLNANSDIGPFEWFKYQVKVSVEPLNSSGVAETPYEVTLSVEYSPEGNVGNLVDTNMHQMLGKHGANVTILETALETDTGIVFNASHPSINLSLQFLSDTFQALSNTPITVFLDQLSEGTQPPYAIALRWPQILGAEEYDLEWTWVDNYGPISGGNALSANQIEFSVRDFELNNTRVQLNAPNDPSAQLRFEIPLVYSRGYIIYRVRAVGRFQQDTSIPFYGQWTAGNSNEANIQGWISANTNAVYLVGNSHESNKNWQFQASYAEDGKKKEVASYFDGRLSNRQTVTKINSDDNAIVGEVFNDNQGRPAIEVLPVPANNNVIRYYNNFNRNLGQNKYSHLDFDWDIPGNDPSCNVTTGGMSTISGSSKYYSPNNTVSNNLQDFVPDAQNFPFSQIQYTTDNTGRVRSKGGVGPDHQIGNGSGHEMKYFYSQPGTSFEINRLFGYQVGFLDHYKKNVVVDPNGQASVSYIDPQGRTIATALAGGNPNKDGKDILLPLEDEQNASLHDFLVADLMNDNNLYSTGRFGLINDGYVVNKQITSTQNFSDYEFDYSFQEGDFSFLCLEKYPFSYDLKLSVLNDCGDEMLDQGTIDVQDINSFELTDPLNAQLNVGEYTVIKNLTVNEQAIEKAWQEFLYQAQTNQSCILTKEDFILINFDCSEFDCSILDQGEDNYIASNLEATYNDGVDYYFSNGNLSFPTGVTDQLEQEIQAFYNGLVAAFDVFEDFCTEKTMCDINRQTLLADMSPSGQYGNINFEVDADGISTGVIIDDTNNEDFTSVFNTNNQLFDVSDGSNSFHDWKHPTTDYSEADGSVSYIEVVLQNPGDPSGVDIWQPQIDGGVTPIELNNDGVLYVKPQQLSNVTDFIAEWRPSWAESLLEYHPEYCYLEYVNAVCANTETATNNSSLPVLNSFQYDDYIRNISTYQEAQNLGLIGSGFLQIMDNDPYFSSVEYASEGTDSSIDFAELRTAIMEHALTENFEGLGDDLTAPNIFPLLSYSLAVLEFGSLMNLSDIAGLPNSASGLYSNINSLTPSEQDAIWIQYVNNYIGLKGKIYDVFLTVHAYKGGCYNSCLNGDIIDQSTLDLAGSDYNIDVTTGGGNYLSPLQNYLNVNFPSASSNTIQTTIEGNIQSNPPANSLCPNALYNGKIKRFPGSTFLYNSEVVNNDDDPFDGSDNTYYELTGKCKIQLDLELFIRGYFEENHTQSLLTNQFLYNGSYMTANLYDELVVTDPKPTIQGEIINQELTIGIFKSNCNKDAITINLPADLSWNDYGTTWNFVDDIGVTEMYHDTSVNDPTRSHFMFLGTIEINGEIREYVFTGSTCLSLDACVCENNSGNGYGPDGNGTASNPNPDCFDRSEENIENIENAFMSIFQYVYDNTNNLPAGSQTLVSDVLGINTPEYNALVDMLAGADQLVENGGAEFDLNDINQNMMIVAQQAGININYRFFVGNFDLSIGLGDFNLIQAHITAGYSQFFNDFQVAIAQDFILPMDFTQTYININTGALKHTSYNFGLSYRRCRDWGRAISGLTRSEDTNLRESEQSPEWDDTNIFDLPANYLSDPFTIEDPLFDCDHFDLELFKSRLETDLTALLNVVLNINDPDDIIPLQNIPEYSSFLQDVIKLLALANGAVYEGSTYDFSTAYFIKNKEFGTNSYTGIYFPDLHPFGYLLDLTSLGTNLIDNPGNINIYAMNLTMDYTTLFSIHPTVLAVNMSDSHLIGYTLNGNAVANQDFYMRFLAPGNYVFSGFADNVVALTPCLIACDDTCITQTVEPLSCNEKWIDFQNIFEFQPITYTDTSGDNPPAPDEILFEATQNILGYTLNAQFNEEYFCAMNLGYIVDDYELYINTITAAPYNVSSPDHPLFLTIAEFGDTDLNYGFNDTATVIADYFNTVVVDENNTISVTWNNYVNNTWVPNNDPCLPAPMIGDYNIEVDYPDPCETIIESLSEAYAYDSYMQYLSDLKADFTEAYITQAMQNANEKFTMTYPDKEYQYTLYYYDQAGNLIQTVPPEGTKRMGDGLSANEKFALNVEIDNTKTQNTANQALLPNHGLKTQYQYNSLNQLVWQQTPDGGITIFGYDALGRIIVSQNAKQIAEDNKFSYTKYDELGRIEEAGQMQLPSGYTINSNGILVDNSGNTVTQVNTSAYPQNIAVGDREQVTVTYYDQMPFNKQSLFENYGNNDRNRVTAVLYYNTYPAPVKFGCDNALYYDYDIHGNVKEFITEYNHSKLLELPGDYHIKRVLYEYDLISGNVNQVTYQKNREDQFIHKYQYDADNRITGVRTSTNNIIWENDASYTYYEHGPLARVLIGDKQVQGLDYAYTLQGWLKGVNSNATIPTEMGGDAATNTVAKDAFAFALHYFNKDYIPRNASNPFATTDNYYNTNTLGLYNGNIRAMSTALLDINEKPLKTSSNSYQYDQLNRIMAMSNMEGATTNATPISQGINNRYAYDRNGNLKQLMREAKIDGNIVTMDNLEYGYNVDGSGNLINNQLNIVKDAVPDNVVDNVDIDSHDYEYEYDQIGQLTQDIDEGIKRITWRVDGKIAAVDKTDGEKISFTYDGLGNRIAKHVASDKNNKTTYYRRDTRGNVLSVYTLMDDRDGDNTPSVFDYDLELTNANIVAPPNLLHQAQNTIMVAGGLNTYTVSSSGYVELEAGQLITLKPGFTASPTTPEGYFNARIVPIAPPSDLTYTLAEQHIYGSSRLGLQQPERKLLANVAGKAVGITIIDNIIGDKRYELSNHLGNVLSVISDRKLRNNSVFKPDVLAFNDYNPFGSLILGRHGSTDSYRYGYQGNEKDDEIQGEGNTYTSEFRSYDPRLGRYMSMDPYTTAFASHSPYSHALNNPIILVDKDGDFPKPSKFLKEEFGLDLPPLAAGIMDGIIENIGWVSAISTGKLVYDVFTDKGQRQAFFEGIKSLISDPIGTLKAIGKEYMGLVERLANGTATDEDWYQLGYDGSGIIVGGGAKMFIKKLVRHGKSQMSKRAKRKARKMFDCASCFTGDTPVLTTKGYVDIKDLNIGDVVWYYNSESKTLEEKEIVHKNETNVDTLYRVFIAGEYIDVPEKFTFIINDKEVMAKDIKAGDVITLYNGITIAIDKVEVLEGNFKLYDVELTTNKNTEKQ